MHKEDDKKGYWFDDKFKSFIKGYTYFQSTYKDARKFSIEIDGVSNNLFPGGSDDEKFFIIKHCDPNIQTKLNEYFIERHNRAREDLFGNSFDLSGFFNSCIHRSVTLGESFDAIDWETKNIGTESFVLPSRLRYLNNSTMKVKKNKRNIITAYKQQYSFLAKFFEHSSRHKINDFNFNCDEVFYTKYPLEKIWPVKKSMRLIKPILKFWELGLKQSEYNASQNTKRLDLLIASQKCYSREKRNFILTRAKIRRNFHYLLNVDDNMLEITEYFDIYMVTKYKKELNLVREYLVQAFNDQILKPFSIKNNIEQIPRLELISFLDNKELDLYFDKYKNKEITAEEFTDKVIRND